jgi:hypothetical protein
MYAYAAVLIAGLVFGFTGGWKTNGWRYDAQAAAEHAAAARDLVKRVDRIDEAAAKHEDFKAKEEVRYVERVKVVRQLVDRPVYRNVCLDDDGVRLLNNAAAGRDNPGQPAPAVPAAAKP